MRNSAITIICKPTSECNFRCDYCYHANTKYEDGILDLFRLERLIRLAQEEYQTVNYIWHGGEPLLCGLDFFVEAIKLQNRYGQSGVEVSNSIQTNGSLVTDDFIDFFTQNKFDISVSIDGPDNNNCLRQNTDIVIKNIEKMQNAKLNVSSISVIHAINVDHQIQMYNFFKSMNLPMKFNPIFKDGSAIQNSLYLLEVGHYLDSLKSLYDHWLVDQTAVMVDPIDQYLSMVIKNRGIDCIYGSCLGHWLGIDHSGNLYPCGRSYTFEYQLANIDKVDRLSEAFESEAFAYIIKKAIIRRSLCQEGCDFFGICHGGCSNNALLEHGDMAINDGFLCEVLREMYVYVKASLDPELNSQETFETYNPIIKRILNQSISKETES